MSSIKRLETYRRVEIPEPLLDVVQTALRSHGLEVGPYIKRGSERLQVRYATGPGVSGAGFIPPFLRISTGGSTR